jgi:TPR repeat protein
LERGDVYLRAGDIASARLFYERAADAGDGQAALQVGATFDPMFLASVGLRSMPGDPAKALYWYRRALGLGAGEAEPHVKRLESK